MVTPCYTGGRRLGAVAPFGGDGHCLGSTVWRCITASRVPETADRRAREGRDVFVEGTVNEEGGARKLAVTKRNDWTRFTRLTKGGSARPGLASAFPKIPSRTG